MYLRFQRAVARMHTYYWYSSMLHHTTQQSSPSFSMTPFTTILVAFMPHDDILHTHTYLYFLSPPTSTQSSPRTFLVTSLLFFRRMPSHHHAVFHPCHPHMSISNSMLRFDSWKILVLYEHKYVETLSDIHGKK